MFVKQLSVFIENKEGRLGEVLDVLKARQVRKIFCGCSGSKAAVDCLMSSNCLDV